MLIKIGDKTVFAFSDTHNHHRRLKVPEDADIVICDGDAVEDNLKGSEYEDFISWFGSLPAKWKLFVPAIMNCLSAGADIRQSLNSLRQPES